MLRISLLLLGCCSLGAFWNGASRQPRESWYYGFAQLTPVASGDLLAPGEVDAGGVFHPWRNILIDARDIPSLTAKIKNRPMVDVGGVRLGVPVDPPLRTVKVVLGEPAQEYYLLGLHMEPRKHSEIFFAFRGVGIRAATYRDLPERAQLPSAVSSEGIEIVSILTPPQYAKQAQQFAEFGNRDAAVSTTGIEIGAAIAVTAAPYRLPIRDGDP